MINNFNENLEQYILNHKNEFEIPFYFTTLIILALNKKNGLIMALFAIFYIVIRVFNETKIINEKPLINNIMESDKNIIPIEPSILSIPQYPQTVLQPTAINVSSDFYSNSAEDKFHSVTSDKTISWTPVTTKRATKIASFANFAVLPV